MQQKKTKYNHLTFEKLHNIAFYLNTFNQFFLVTLKKFIQIYVFKSLQRFFNETTFIRLKQHKKTFNPIFLANNVEGGKSLTQDKSVYRQFIPSILDFFYSPCTTSTFFNTSLLFLLKNNGIFHIFLNFFYAERFFSMFARSAVTFFLCCQFIF